jgi:hypothetical protein
MSIADKLATVAENQQKVFDAGKKSVCPAIHESGAMVVCCPFDMTVTASAEVNTITRCGKNLLDLRLENIEKITYWGPSGNLSSEYWGVELILPPGTYTIKATAQGSSSEYVYCQVNDLAKTKHIKTMSPVVGTPRAAQTATFTEWVRLYIYEATVNVANGQTPTGAANIFAKHDIQLEASPAATAFEPYVGETFTPGEDIPALPGVNTIYADAGEITVTGTADPIATIEYLTNAIISFGGNV